MITAQLIQVYNNIHLTAIILETEVGLYHNVCIPNSIGAKDDGGGEWWVVTIEAIRRAKLLYQQTI